MFVTCLHCTVVTLFLHFPYSALCKITTCSPCLRRGELALSAFTGVTFPLLLLKPGGSFLCSSPWNLLGFLEGKLMKLWKLPWNSSPFGLSHRHASPHLGINNLSKLPFRCPTSLWLQVTRVQLCFSECISVFPGFRMAVSPATWVFWKAQKKSVIFVVSGFSSKDRSYNFKVSICWSWNQKSKLLNSNGYLNWYFRLK